MTLPGARSDTRGVRSPRRDQRHTEACGFTHSHLPQVLTECVLLGAGVGSRGDTSEPPASGLVPVSTHTRALKGIL